MRCDSRSQTDRWKPEHPLKCPVSATGLDRPQGHAYSLSIYAVATHIALLDLKVIFLVDTERGVFSLPDFFDDAVRRCVYVNGVG